MNKSDPNGHVYSSRHGGSIFGKDDSDEDNNEDDESEVHNASVDPAERAAGMGVEEKKKKKDSGVEVAQRRPLANPQALSPAAAARREALNSILREMRNLGAVNQANSWSVGVGAPSQTSLLRAQRQLNKIRSYVKSIEGVAKQNNFSQGTFASPGASLNYHHHKHGLARGLTPTQYAREARSYYLSNAGNGTLKIDRRGQHVVRMGNRNQGGLFNLNGDILSYWRR